MQNTVKTQHTVNYKLIKLFILGAFFISVYINAQDYRFTSFKSVNHINSMIPEGDYMWMGGNNGVIKVHTETGNIVDYQSENNGLISDYVNCMIIDNSDNKWVGTYFGISKYDGMNWVSYDQTVGIHDNVIYSMAIDTNNQMWFGSYGGLVCFNGDEWTKILVKGDSMDLDIFSRDSLCIADLKIDSKNIKWIGTYDGLFKYNNTEWIQYKISDDGMDNWISCVEIDDNDTIWFGTYTGKLGKFYNDSMTIYEIDGNDGEKIRSLSIGTDGKKWVITDSSVYVFNGINWSFIRNIPYSYYAMSSGIDDEGNIWISGKRILCKYDNAEWSEHVFSEVPGIGTTALNIDNDDNLWVTTDETVTRFDWATWETYDLEEMSNRDIRSMYSILNDASNNIWVGANTYDDISAIIFKFDGTLWTTFDKANSNFDLEYVSELVIDKNEVIWVAGLSDTLYFYDGITWNSISYGQMNFNELAVDENNNLWCGTVHNGVQVYDGSNWTSYTRDNGLPSNHVNDIVVDHQNRIWVLLDRALCYYDGGIWTTLINSSPTSIPIRTLHIDNENKVWCGHYDQGISIYNDTSWLYFSTEDGLADNQVNSIASDSKNNTWIATPQGLTLAYRSLVILDLAKGWTAKGGGITQQYKHEDRMENIYNRPHQKSVNNKPSQIIDDVPESILVPLTVQEFTKIKSFQFSINFDPEVIQFSQLQNLQLYGISESDFDLSQVADGIITINYSNSDIVFQSITDDTAIFYVKFDVVGSEGDISSIDITSDPVPVTIIYKNGSELDYYANSFNFILGEYVNVNTFSYKDNIIIYPNPCNSYLYIDNTSNIERVSFYNYIGRSILDIPNVDGESRILIDTKKLHTGVYIIHCFSKNNDRITGKIIVSR